MRKQLSDFIKIQILKKSNGVDSGPVDFTVTADNSVVFEESPKRSTAGVLYQQALRLIITREEASRMPRLPSMVKAIVTLSDCGDSYVWGDADIPVEIVITPRLEVIELECSRNSVRSLFAGGNLQTQK